MSFNGLFKQTYLLGILFRNKKIFRNYKFLLQSQNWDIDSLKNHQINKVKKLIHFAYNNTDYYRNLFDKNKISPNDINSLHDLKKIPVLEKEDLLNNIKKIQIQDYPEKLFYSETSGSTGKPLVFFRNMDWDAWHNASVLRGYSWFNVNPWDRNGYLWGYNFSLKQKLKTRFLDFLQNRFRLFSYNNTEFLDFIKKLEKASFLGGYSSMIYEIAKKINKMEKGKPHFSLKMIKGTSEKIFDKYQEEVISAFGKKMISEYGAAESGIIAFECPEGNMHINMETVIVEEENNEIIVTNLVSNSLPIIRYKLGDYIVIDENSICKCGRRHYILKEVTGRVGRKIYGFKEQYPSLTLYYVFKNLAIEHAVILNYQAIQSESGKIDLYIENELSEEKRHLLIGEFNKYFNKDIALQIIDKANLKTSGRKKQDFISNL